MVLPRERIGDQDPADTLKVQDRPGLTSVRSGGYNGGGADLSQPLRPEPMGLPPDLLQKYELSEKQVKRQKEFEDALGTIGVDYANLTDEQVARAAVRGQMLYEAIPDLPGQYAQQFILGDMPIEDAIVQAKTAWMDQNKPWWKKIVEPVATAWQGIADVDVIPGGGEFRLGTIGEGILAGLDGVEWVWNKTVVDPMQEIAQLAGIDEELAQRLSPGRVVEALYWDAAYQGRDMLQGKIDTDLDSGDVVRLAVNTVFGGGAFLVGGVLSLWDRDEDPAAIDAFSPWKTDEEGNRYLTDPAAGEWSLWSQTRSGALDVVARWYLDPLAILGRARKGIHYTEGAFHYVKSLDPVDRIKDIARYDLDKARRRGLDLVEGGRTSAFKNWVMGDLSSRQYWSTLVSGSKNAKRFLDDIDFARKANPDNWIDPILRKYGERHRGRGGVTIQQIAQMDGMMRQFDNVAHLLPDGISPSKEAFLSILTGRFSAIGENAVSRLRNRALEIVAHREAAWDHFDRGRRHIYEGVTADLAEDLPGRVQESVVRIDGHGRVRGNLDRYDENSVRGLIEESFGHQDAVRNASRETLIEALNTGKIPEGVRYNHWEEELQALIDDIHPFFKAAGMSTPDAAHVVDDLLAHADNLLQVQKPLTALPMERLYPGGFKWLTHSTPLARIPFAGRILQGASTMFEFMPKGSINVHDPFWVDEVNRLARFSGMPDEEIGEVIARAYRAQSPKEVSEIAEEFIERIYTTPVKEGGFGLNAEQLARLRERVGDQTQSLYHVTADGKEVTRPLITTDEVNSIMLLEPRVLRGMKKINSLQGPTKTAYKAWFDLKMNVLDKFFTTFKRLQVMLPRSGLRVLLETQGRAAMVGAPSIAHNPIAIIGAFVLAPISPEKAKKFVMAFQPKYIREIFLEMGDYGGLNAVEGVGLFQRSKRTRPKAHRFAEVGGKRQQKRYRDAQAKVINDMLHDQLVQQVLRTGPEKSRRWLLSPEASRIWRQRMARTRREMLDPDTGAMLPEEDLAPILNEIFDDLTSSMENLNMLHPDLSPKLVQPNGDLRRLNSEDLLDFESEYLPGGDFFDLDENILNRIWDATIARNLGGIENIGRDYTSRAALWQEVQRLIALRHADGLLDDATLRRLVDEGEAFYVTYNTSRAARDPVEGAVYDILDGLPDEDLADLALNLAKDPTVRGVVRPKKPLWLRKEPSGDLADNIINELSGTERLEQLRNMNPQQLADEIETMFGSKIRHVGSHEDVLSTYAFKLAEYGGYDAVIDTATRQVNVLNPVAYVRKTKLDAEAIQRTLRGEQVKGFNAEKALVRQAKHTVQEQMKWLFYDLANHSRFSEMFRYIIPFGNAYQEVMQTWAAILLERPWIGHQASVLMQNIDDNPIAQVYTDGNGVRRFRIPVADKLFAMAGLRSVNPITGEADIGFSIEGALGSLNVVSTGLPMLGPLVDIPLRMVKKHIPAGHDIYEALFPYGDPDLLESFQFPGFAEVKNLISTWVTDNPKADSTYATILGSLTLEEVMGIIRRAEVSGDMSKLKALDKLKDAEGLGDKTLDDVWADKSVIHKARIIFAISAASAMAFPTRLTAKSPLAPLIEYHRFMKEATTPDIADRAMVTYINEIWNSHDNMEVGYLGKDINGKPLTSRAFKALLAPATEAREGTDLPPFTTTAAELLRDDKMRDFFKAYGDVGEAIFNESRIGPFDRQLFRDAVERGDQFYVGPQNRIQAAEKMLMWDYYFQYKNSLDARMLSLGIPPGSQTKAAEPFNEAKKQFMRRLQAAFPVLTPELLSFSEQKKWDRVAKLGILSNVEQLQRLDSMQGVRKYFALRQKMHTQAQLIGVRSMTAKDIVPLLNAWNRGVREIAMQHPHFGSIWGMYLQGDDFTIPMFGYERGYGESDVKGVVERSGIIRLGGLTEEEMMELAQ